MRKMLTLNLSTFHIENNICFNPYPANVENMVSS